MFCSPDGGKLYDMHVGYKASGQFDTEDEFYKSVTGGRTKFLKNRYSKAFMRPHNPVFTHGDLYLSNIMVGAGKFSGLIDWEMAGFYPDYWDNTQALLKTFDLLEAAPMWQKVWKDDHKEEVEMTTWWIKKTLGCPGDEACA